MIKFLLGVVGGVALCCTALRRLMTDYEFVSRKEVITKESTPTLVLSARATLTKDEVHAAVERALERSRVYVEKTATRI